MTDHAAAAAAYASLIPVISYSDLAYSEPPRPSILLGRQMVAALRGGGAGLGDHDSGRLVEGISLDGHSIYRRFVAARYRFDPNSRNRLGEMGAYVPVELTNADLARQIEQARSVLRLDIWRYQQAQHAQLEIWEGSAYSSYYNTARAMVWVNSLGHAIAHYDLREGEGDGSRFPDEWIRVWRQAQHTPPYFSPGRKTIVRAGQVAQSAD